MPLVKRSTAAPAAAPDDRAASAADLGNPDPDRRWHAARALGEDAAAVPALAAALAREESARVREAIITALVRIGDAASVAALLPCLRASDASVRSAAVEGLSSLPQQLTTVLPELLRDNDSDVRILATELTRNMPASDATRLLSDVLANEAHPNVCAAAVEVLTEVGTPDALPALQVCARRFAGTPFLPFAISIAVARIANESDPAR